MKKVLAVTALLGLAGVTQVADATPVAATLVSVHSWVENYEEPFDNGSVPWNRSLDTSTWTFDADTGTAAQTGGTYSALVKYGTSPAMRHTMTGAILSGGLATATTWACIDGAFGPLAGQSICGNYSFGADFTNDSTYTPTATGGAVTIGGDDYILGAPLTLANSYSSLVSSLIGGAPPGFQRYLLSNKAGTVCPGETTVITTCGYDFVFETDAVVPVPPAVWLFGSALGLMGVMRRKISS